MTAPLGRSLAAASSRAALVRLLDRLAAADYAFVTTTPATHRRVAGRRDRARPGCLRDVFGWSLPFGAQDLPAPLIDDLRSAGALEADGPHLRATVRVSTLEGRLHLHSAPGDAADAVFLGPDSYRFVRYLAAELERRPAFSRALDIGVGAGAGALALAARRPDAEVVGLDVNPLALAHLQVNAEHQGSPVKGLEGAGPSAADGTFDLIVANPPYIAGSGGRIYRDGGEDHGTALGLSWVADSLDGLSPGGRIVLYTGSPVVDGEDRVRAALSRLADEAGLQLRYEEIDPDVFGGVLGRAAYRDVERIAAVGAVLSRERG